MPSESQTNEQNQDNKITFDELNPKIATNEGKVSNTKKLDSITSTISPKEGKREHSIKKEKSNFNLLISHFPLF